MRQLVVIAAALVTGLSLLAVELPAQGRGKGKDKAKGSVAQQQWGTARTGKIPPGHLPRAGECRVWFDGRPPGQQPSPTSCARARADAYRSGGRLVYGGDRKNERYDDRNDDRYPDDRRYPDNARYPSTLPDVITDVILGRGGRVPR
jgi:hypothetical protein